jgi:hypoxanthine phosphoribosyltransferase
MGRTHVEPEPVVTEDVDDAAAEREVLSYEEFGVAARQLAQSIHDDGYRPDIILTIARGGLFLGGALAYALAVKNLHVMNVEFYVGVDQRLDFPVMLPPVLNLVDIRGARVLVADDVADTGETLNLVLRHCGVEVAEIRSVVLYEKPRSVVHCDYVWRHTDRWIDFPWSSLPPVTGHASSDA